MTDSPFAPEDTVNPTDSMETKTVTTNPVKHEAKGTEEPHVTEGKAVDINPATIGYDTSQL